MLESHSSNQHLITEKSCVVSSSCFQRSLDVFGSRQTAVSGLCGYNLGHWPASTMLLCPMPAGWFISSYLHTNRMFITGETGVLPFFWVDGTNWILLELVCETSSVKPLSALCVWPSTSVSLAARCERVYTQTAGLAGRCISAHCECQVSFLRYQEFELSLRRNSF